MRTHESIIASGGIEAMYILGSAAVTSAFYATRVNDISWSLGGTVLSFFVAGASREDAAIRDIALGTLASSAGFFVLRMMGKLNRFSGQQ